MFRINNQPDTAARNDWTQCSEFIFWSELRKRWFPASIIALIISFNMCIIYWNENRDVHSLRSLSEALHAVKTLRDVDVSLAENDQKLVHLFGRLTTDRELSAPEYGVSIRAVKLRRRVEMYQWFEEKSFREDGTDDDDDDDDDGDDRESDLITYSYHKTWHPEVIQSRMFYLSNQYANPTVMHIRDALEVVDIVRIGCFVLSPGLVDKINKFKPFTGHIRPPSPDIKLHAGLYYHTQNVWDPKIGDVRMEFAHAGLAGDQAEMVTIIAKQEGQKLVPFITYSGDQLSIIHFGRKSPEEIFQIELPRNHWQTWLWRLATYFGMFVATNGAVYLIDTIVSTGTPPILSDLLKLGTTFLAISLTLVFFMFTMAISWVRYKVFIGIGFLVLSLLPIALATLKLYKIDLSKKRRQH